MHAVGIHSAMAIKRQRKRRDDQRKAKERRYSIQSSESGDTQHSPHGSTRRKHRHQTTHSAGNGMLDTKVNNYFKTFSNFKFFCGFVSINNYKTQNANIINKCAVLV